MVKHAINNEPVAIWCNILSSGFGIATKNANIVEDIQIDNPVTDLRIVMIQDGRVNYVICEADFLAGIKSEEFVSTIEIEFRVKVVRILTTKDGDELYSDGQNDFFVTEVRYK